MKFALHGTDEQPRVELAGDLVASDCNCIQSFWDCHVPDGVAAIDVDMAAVDSLDGESVAVLTNIIRRHVAEGTEVTLYEAPQMLAHTLYKIGMLDHPALTLIDPRHDEQHHT
ncbi:MAG: hypothetical protein H6817_06465 [Phycisphaerales bacterium]|nr:hypothetical protein [Phycisphaerales bacterium]